MESELAVSDKAYAVTLTYEYEGEDIKCLTTSLEVAEKRFQECIVEHDYADDIILYVNEDDVPKILKQFNRYSGNITVL